MKPTFATKVRLITVCKWVSPQYTIDCFADINTQEACTVTRKLDLDQMSERSIRTLKDTDMSAVDRLFRDPACASVSTKLLSALADSLLLIM